MKAPATKRPGFADEPPVPWILGSTGRLLATLVLVIGLPLAVTMTIGLRHVRRSLLGEAIDHNTTATRQSALTVREHFQSLLRRLEELAQSPTPAMTQLQQLVNPATGFACVFTADAHGTVQMSFPSEAAVKVPIPAGTGMDKPFLTGVQRQPGRVPVVMIVCPVLNDLHQVVGYVAGQETIKHLSQLMVRLAPVNGAMLMVDASGMAVTTDGTFLQIAPGTPDAGLHNRMAGLAPDPVSGESSLIARAPVMGWSVWTSQPLASVYAPVRVLETSIVLLSFGGFLVIVVGGIIVLGIVQHHQQAVADRNAQLAADLALARSLQPAMVPAQYPVLPRANVQFGHRIVPTSAVGGDFFDAFAVSDASAGVLLCDVLGHGLRATAVEALTRALVADLRTTPHAADPGRFLTELNRRLAALARGTGPGIYVSAVFVVVDVGAGQLRCANAGHASPLQWRGGAEPGQSPQFIHCPPEPALGLIEDYSYSTHTAPLAAGDRIVLFSDGLYEARSPGGAVYGLERLLAAAGKLPAEQLLDALVAEVRQFSAGEDIADDICLISIDVPNFPGKS